jgi:hypothetical protein
MSVIRYFFDLVFDSCVSHSCLCSDLEKSTNTAAIVGGVIGGVLGLLIIAAVVLCVLSKRKKDRAKLVGRFDRSSGLFF